MNIIPCLVLRQDNFNYPLGVAQGVSEQHITAKSVYWRQPIVGSGLFTGNYKWILAYGDNVTKPTADCVKALHLRNDVSGTDIYVALTDGGGVNDFTSRMSACCDAVTPMPAVTIPDPIVEETACPDADDNRNFFTVTRVLAAGEVYDFVATLDKVPLLATQNEGFASLAAFEIWADANWAPAGVSIAGLKVTLTSATATTGSIQTNIKKYYESGAPGALGGGQHYHLAATVNGTVLAPIDGAADAALSTVAIAANADVTYASFGKWSVVAGKIRLVSANATSAALVVTIA